MRAHSPSAPAHERWRPVPATPSPVRLSLPARARNIAVVRRALEAIAEELAVPRRLVEDMRLAVTEACTNVVRHAYSGAEADDQNALRVELRPQPRGMLVIVEDRGRGLAPSPDGGGPGLGLPLIAALTEDLEISHGPDNRGSRVAMSFAPVIEAA
jgi:serine/threonine-protein kinase RsbW